MEHSGQQCVQPFRISVGDPRELALSDFLCQLLLVVSSERRSKRGQKTQSTHQYYNPHPIYTMSHPRES